MTVTVYYESTGSSLLGTRRYNFEPPTPTTSATIHIVADRQTDRRHTDSIVPVRLDENRRNNDLRTST